MKKTIILSFLLAFIIVFISISAGVTPAHAATSGDYTYTDNGDGTCTLTGYSGAAVDLEIPATLGGLAVTSIGSAAIFHLDSLTSLTIPSGVTSIGCQSISYCSSLTSITLPSSLTSIADKAIFNCSSLTGLTIPSGVTSIGESPFYECRKVTNIIVDAGNQNYSSDGEILYNEDKSVLVCCPQGLTSVTIPDGVTSIANSAFLNCYELTSVTLPSGVTSIGDRAFRSTKLTSITIPNSVTSIGEQAFANTRLTSVTIPSGVTSIKSSTFEDCGSLAIVSIPDSVTSIGDYAFSCCTELTGLTIPAGVTSIGISAFASCCAITDITIPSGITSIADGVFSCAGLTSVMIPFGVTSIGARAFNNCDSLSSITIPNSVTSIGEQAFQTCSKLANITIPDSVTVIGQNAFCNCIAMTSIEVSAGNQNYSSSNGVLYNKSKSELICCPAKLTSVTIPNSVTSINDYAFAFCAGLSSVTIPDSVTSIGTVAFYYCTVLSKVYLDGSMPAMGSAVFSFCPATPTFYCPDTNPGGITLTPLTQVPTKTITVLAENGTITPSTYSGMPGETISINVEPATGYRLQDGSLKYNDGSDHPLNGSSFTMPDSNITISAVFDEMTIAVGSQNSDMTAGSATFAATTANIADGAAVTVNWCDAGGSAVSAPAGLSASGTNIASNGSTVTVTAGIAALPGTYYFKVTSAGAASSVVTLTVQVTHTVTFKDWDGTTLKTQTVNNGAGATASANPNRTGFTFTGWDKVFNNVTSDLTVTAQYSANDSDNGGGGTPASNAQKTETVITGNTATATTTTTATSDSSGKATASVPHVQVSDIIGKAVEEAAKCGNGMAAVAEIKVESAADARLVEAILPTIAVDSAAKSNVDALTVSTPIASITFDKEALKTLAGAAAENVTISTAKVETAALSEETKQIVGDRPVYNFSVTSGDKTISQFNGNVTVSVPYTPITGEDTSAIIIYYINAEGKAGIVSNCTYDPETGTVIFTTSHFSFYAVGYNKMSFNDVSENSWYGNAVSFIAARGITTGTGNGNFSPDAKLTRGEFLVMMMRAYGISSDTDPADNFADAGSTYYTGYLAAAKRMGISDGVGNNMFAPEQEIARQEMFTLLYNALKVLGQLPQGTESHDGGSGKTLSDFTDAGQIESWAKDAMTLLVKTGTVGGSSGALMPLCTTTRAEMTQVLYNLFAK